MAGSGTYIIDPLSIATQGYRNKQGKCPFPISLATLGLLTPRADVEELVRKRLAGGRGVAIGFKSTVPRRKPEFEYDLTIKAAFRKVNDEEVDQDLVVKRYRDSHKPIEVGIRHLVHRNEEIELGLYEVIATSVRPKIKVDNVKLVPLRTIVSSSIILRNKKKKK